MNVLINGCWHLEDHLKVVQSHLPRDYSRLSKDLANLEIICKNKKFKKRLESLKLTARGHRQGEERHSPGQQIQAASLISQGPPTGLQGQTNEQAHCATLGSC